MKTLIQMRAERESIAKAVNELNESTEGKEWTAENQATYDDLMGKLKTCNATIKRTEEINDEAALEAPPIDPKDPNKAENQQQEDGDPTPAQLYNKWVRQGWEGLSMEEIQAVRNTMSTTTDSEGGYTIQTEVAASVIDKLQEYGGMREIADVFRTSKGNPMSWPTTDGTNEEGEIVAENQSASDEDVDFGTKSLGVYKYSSKVVTVPWELLQDSEVDVEAIVNGRLQTRLGRITNKHFTIGTGVAQPNGVVPMSALGVTAAGAAVVTYDELVALMHKIDPAYRMNTRFMMHDASMEMIRKLKDGDGRPLFWSSARDLSEALPMNLLGRPVSINQDTPAPTTGNRSIIYGDFKKYKIRDVMQVTLFRFTDSAYVKKGQVGFLAWMRSGGNYTDIGASMVHLVQG